MKKDAIKISIAFILFIIAIFVPFQYKWILYVISYLIVGLEIIKEAIENIIHGELFDENFLMTIATIGAFALGEFPEAVAVMLFYQIGELFQNYAVDKSKKSIASLMEIRPDYAFVKRNEEILKVNPEEVKIGETIIVKPGEKIPLDGKVIEGNSMLDTSSITGESLPRKVKIGEEVISGCVNQTSVLTIQVTKPFGESTVSKILDLVENASSKKAKSENFIHTFAKYYTPIVVVIAVLLTILPPIFVPNANFIDWLYRGLTFLVVSCPCALVISIPLGFFGGIGGASKKGILIKGGNYLEALSKAEIAVFDKTGTLTKGTFEVQKIESINIEKEEFIKLVAYAEHYSNHPIANSVKKAYTGKIEEGLIHKTEELSGLGIEATIEEKHVLVGNEKLMKEKQIAYNKCEEIGTILYVAINEKYAGYIVISDTIKEDAKEAIQKLKENKIKQTILLTGDKKEVAEQVAKTLQIDKVYSELLPNEKAEKLEEIKKQSKGKVLFVGDGINDAPVLALADIGIAMGALGSDAAIEASNIVIMTDEPSKVAKAMNISRKTMKIVKQNIIFAISVKIAVLILSALGISTMWEAVFADVGVSFLAVLNALRMLK